ncbi:type II secretion system protein GspM [Pseudomonas sp. NPDC012596]|uniref:type II secretion system protein GspM n=1 Tax=Pseudomonas sp. NPDC012596 TaxID=3364419 RepID=UPI0036AFA646
MKRWADHALARQWQQVPAGRKALLKAALWGLALVLVWQLAWLPAQARLQEAERKLTREHEIGVLLQRVTRAPVRVGGVARRTTPASLSESARLVGISVTGLQTRAGQVDISLQGPPAAVLSWLHSLEQEVEQLSNIQLQREGEALQARFVMELPD